MSQKGNLYVISAPSGTGKTTLVKAIVNEVENITVSISHTTRPKRPAEINGVNYYFISKDEFLQMVDQKAFLEHAQVFGNCYGTSHSWVEETLANGVDVILEIDWQGAQQIQHLFTDSISIFILPPSLTVLYDRLVNRNQDNIEIIHQRIGDVRESTSHIKEYDYVIINDVFEKALSDLKLIIKTGRLLQHCQSKTHADLIEQLCTAKISK